MVKFSQSDLKFRGDIVKLYKSSKNHQVITAMSMKNPSFVGFINIGHIFGRLQFFATFAVGL